MTNIVLNEKFESGILKIPDKSVHCIITDPPNIIGNPKNFSFKNTIENELFATFDFAFFAKQMYRICKDKSSIVIFGNTKFQSAIFKEMESAGFTYVVELIWVKPNAVNFQQAKHKPTSRHELMTVWRKKQLNFNYIEAKQYGFDNYENKYVSDNNKMYAIKRKGIPTQSLDGSRFMTTILYAKSKGQLDIEERTDHPTQKPEELIRQIVKAFSFETEIIVDIFAGSGTTPVSAIKEKRNYIAIEMNPKWYDLINKRIEKTKWTIKL